MELLQETFLRTHFFLFKLSGSWMFSERLFLVLELCVCSQLMKSKTKRCWKVLMESLWRCSALITAELNFFNGNISLIVGFSLIILKIWCSPGHASLWLTGFFDIILATILLILLTICGSEVTERVNFNCIRAASRFL